MERTTTQELRLDRTGRARSRRRVVAATTAGLMLLGSAVFADSVVAPADVEKAPGDMGSASFYLVAEDNVNAEEDPVNNCNANTQNPVKIDVTSDNAAVTIDAPGYVEVDKCGSTNAESIGYTVATDAPDGTVITVTGTATGGKTVKVKISDGPRPVFEDVPGTFVADSFTITVVDVGARAAAAIANDLVKAGGYEDCLVGLATNRNKTNGHGVLISTIAKEYAGVGDSVDPEDVEESVDTLCGPWTGNN